MKNSLLYRSVLNRGDVLQPEDVKKTSNLAFLMFNNMFFLSILSLTTFYFEQLITNLQPVEAEIICIPSGAIRKLMYSRDIGLF